MQIIKTQTTMTNLKIWLFISYKVNYDGLYMFYIYFFIKFFHILALIINANSSEIMSKPVSKASQSLASEFLEKMNPSR